MPKPLIIASKLAPTGFWRKSELAPDCHSLAPLAARVLGRGARTASALVKNTCRKDPEARRGRKENPQDIRRCGIKGG